jgi:hypothetical protein
MTVAAVAETSHVWFPSNASNREWAVLAAGPRPPARPRRIAAAYPAATSASVGGGSACHLPAAVCVSP